MEIKLTPVETERVFYDALCNGLDYISGYGLRLNWNSDEYVKAKNDLLDEWADMICREDVWIRMLKNGGSLTLEDLECDGEYDSTITIAEVHDRVTLAPEESVISMLREDGDAGTADLIIQSVFYQEIIFG